MNERQTAEQQNIRETTAAEPDAQAQDVRDDSRSGRDEAGSVRRETSFLPEDRMSAMRDEWDDVQAGFVDDPRSSVQRAHGLVTQLVTELTDTFTRERSSLEGQWSGGGQADTEALRVALQRYRDFFNRLLSA